MPTYEYVCEACDHEFEEFQSITARPLRSCPRCRKPRLRRLIGTGAGILFRGSGFYETDYRSEGYKKAAEAERAAAAAGKTSSDGFKSSDGAKSGGDGQAVGRSAARRSTTADATGGASAAESAPAAGPVERNARASSRKRGRR